MENVVVRGLSKCYGENRVLWDFSHVFPAGKISVVMGPSGCGKTTLLRLLLGLEKPDAGEILRTEGLGMSAVFQENRLCENVSAFANLRLVRPELDRETAQRLLHGLSVLDPEESPESALRPVREFSGGMKRRTAILRALIADYDLLLADEPFQGLDGETRRRVMEYFAEQTAGKTVILVTHAEEEAAFFGGEPLLLSRPE